MSFVSDLNLSETDRRRIFELVGIDFGKKSSNTKGWINGLRRPPALGIDRNPSFSVNLQTGAVKDFGSDYSNDLPGFVMDVLYCTFPEAIEWMAAQIGQPRGCVCGTLDRWTGQMPEITVDDALDACERLLAASDDVSRALLDCMITTRGLSDRAVRNRALGVVEMKGRTWLHIPFRNDGRVVTNYKLFAFDYRRGAWVRDEKGKKIVLTRGETVLYMIEQAKYFPDAHLVLCEGELDAILGRQHGLNTITGTAGARTFKPQWAEEIKALPQSDNGITIAYDADEDGSTGALKAAELLAAEDMSVRIAHLPDGKDLSDVLLGR